MVRTKDSGFTTTVGTEGSRATLAVTTLAVQQNRETFYESECQDVAPPRLSRKPLWAWHSAPPWLDGPDRQSAVSWMSQSFCWP